MRKKVCIIHTGGTIGMICTKTGYRPEKGYIKKALSEIKELNLSEMPEYDVIEQDPLIDSSNISMSVWNKIAQDIEERYEKYDGFVILHGTDTMAYTASALSFMFDGLSKPIVLTGSQIPLFQIRNDARDNLISAMLIAGNYKVPEVCLFFRNKLMRGNRAKKISSDELIAFDSPNYQPLAEAGISIILNESIIREPGEILKVTKLKEQKIAVFKIFPGIRYELFEHVMSSDLKGIVIEAYGSGNIPNNHESLINILRKSKDNGTVIVVCTQCLRGSAIIGQYETSLGLLNAGAVSGYDMTIEAAVTKLYYLFSMDYDIETIKLMMGTNLRGELLRK